MIIEEHNNKFISDNESLLKRRTEYCNKLYNYPITPNSNKLINRNNTANEDPLPILGCKVEIAINMLKDGNSPGNDNIPNELIKYGGKCIAKIYTIICQNIWKIKIWLNQWTKSLIIPIMKKYSNYRTLSLIHHQSKILLRIILNRLTTQTEQILAEE